MSYRPTTLIAQILFWSCSIVLSYSTGSATPPDPPAADLIAPDTCEIYLHEVVEQEQRRTRISDRAPGDPQAIDCSGYVSGVELISKRGDLKIALHGQPFAVAPAGPERYRYTYFPKVRGDALCDDDNFAIQFQSAADQRDLTFRHKGARLLTPADKTPDGQDVLPRFRLLGQSPERFRVRGRDLAARLQAVRDGIGYVEKRFDARLVMDVDILAVHDSDNALTLRGQSKIWFYADTFWSESVPELRVMAEHEALHLVVDNAGLTERTSIRGLFAALKGYDIFSVERFTLVTYGRLGNEAAPPKASASPLLAFVDERNYFPGMSGGHAADNLDEFCTSLLHALLYVDRLETNLQRRLSPEGKQQVLSDLARALDVLTKESADLMARQGATQPLYRTTADLFLTARQKATQLSPAPPEKPGQPAPPS